MSRTPAKLRRLSDVTKQTLHNTSEDLNEQVEDTSTQFNSRQEPRAMRLEKMPVAPTRQSINLRTSSRVNSKHRLERTIVTPKND